MFGGHDDFLAFYSRVSVGLRSSLEEVYHGCFWFASPRVFFEEHTSAARRGWCLAESLESVLLYLALFYLHVAQNLLCCSHHSRGARYVVGSLLIVRNGFVNHVLVYAAYQAGPIVRNS